MAGATGKAAAQVKTRSRMDGRAGLAGGFFVLTEHAIDGAGSTAPNRRDDDDETDQDRSTSQDMTRRDFLVSRLPCHGGCSWRPASSAALRRLCGHGRSGSHRRQARLHRADRCRGADDRQGEGPVRQVRHARCRGAEAGLLGRDARQPGARRRSQRHRRRAIS